jgi:hypothetical protein
MAINPLCGLRKSVNKSLKSRVTPILISLALVANSYQQPRVAIPQAERIATATVTIIAAEEIAFRADPSRSERSKGRARQLRLRDGMPLVEFY